MAMTTTMTGGGDEQRDDDGRDGDEVRPAPFLF